MVLSFKLSKTGTRYKPKPPQQQLSRAAAIEDDDPVDSAKDTTSGGKEFQKGRILDGNKDAAGISSTLLFSSGGNPADAEVSFTLNLFPDGYSIVKSTENLTEHLAAVKDNPKLLRPFDRATETFFAAFESGRLPANLLEDIPCKYVNGTVVCVVQDYRQCVSEAGRGSCVNGIPSVHKLCLRMSLENIVKDLPMIAEESWPYRDHMDVESRILKALQPSLCLDPAPNLDRLYEDPTPKLSLDLRRVRKRRLRHSPEVTATKIHGQKVCIDRVPENARGRVGFIGDQVNILSDVPRQQSDPTTNVQEVRTDNYLSDASTPQLPLVHNQPRYQMNVRNPRMIQGHGSGPVMNASGMYPGGQDFISSTNNIGMSSLYGKRKSHDGKLSPLSNINKRSRLTPMGSESLSQQHIGPFLDGLRGQTAQWNDAMLRQLLQARINQHANSGVQKHQSHMFDGVQNREAVMTDFSPALGANFMPNKEQVEADKLDHQQLQFAQRLPTNTITRSGFSQPGWTDLGQQMEKREDQLQKFRYPINPPVSAWSSTQPVLSSKSGEFSIGSTGAQFGVFTKAKSFGTTQKALIGSVPSVSGMSCMTSSGDDANQRHKPINRMTNSPPMTWALSGVASPASVGTNTIPSVLNSLSNGTGPMADQKILERFAKIEMVTNRYNLNAKKNKVDNCSRKPSKHSPQLVAQSLALISSTEDMNNDNWPLPKSIFSGSMNVPKTRAYESR